ncbi:MAG: hypothetical protein ACRCSP_04170 [Rhodoglobus sp.]
MSSGVTLYDPGLGRKAITAALTSLDPSFQMFAQVKIGPGKTEGYRMVGHDDLLMLRTSDSIVWENSRYDATYVVDKAGLDHALTHTVPVVHLGQSEGVDAVIEANPAVRWSVIDLWCPRPIAQQRLSDRGSTDLAERLDVWAATTKLSRCDVSIDTSTKSPVEAALLIRTVAFADNPRSACFPLRLAHRLRHPQRQLPRL